MSKAETITKQAQEKIDTLADDRVDSTNSDVRYLAYGARLRTAIRASTRYIAYVCSLFALLGEILIFLDQ